MTCLLRCAVACCLLAGCSVNDSHIAQRAVPLMTGMSERDLEACLGAPDQHASVEGTDILTWYATSTASMSFSLPIVGGPGFSNGGYCHATFRIDHGVVSDVIYSGEKNALFAPDAYCAPILRSCVARLEARPRAANAASPAS